MLCGFLFQSSILLADLFIDQNYQKHLSSVLPTNRTENNRISIDLFIEDSEQIVERIIIVWLQSRSLSEIEPDHTGSR